MVVRRWTAGENPTAVTPRGVFVLEAGMEELAQSCWEKMSQGADLQKLLQDMASFYATDLSALPSFVAIIEDGTSAHVAVRGPFELVVDTAKGPNSITSGSVITWAEHRLSDVKGWRVSGIVPADHDKDSRWTIESGVVPLTTISSGAVGVVEAELLEAGPIDLPLTDQGEQGDDVAAPASRETAAGENAGGVDREAAPSSVEPAPCTRSTDLEDAEELPTPAGVGAGEPAEGSGEPTDDSAYNFFKSLGLGVAQHGEVEDSQAASDADAAADTFAEYAGDQNGTESASEETRFDSGDTRLEEWSLTPMEAADGSPFLAAADAGGQPAEEELSEYDQLYEATRIRPVEAAAVREVRDSDALEEPASPAAAEPVNRVEVNQVGSPVLPASVAAPASHGFPPPTEGQMQPPPAQPPAMRFGGTAHVYEAPVSPPPPAPAGEFFIDSVPGISTPASPPFGAENAGVSITPPSQVGSALAAPLGTAGVVEEGDHDGHTVVGGKANQFRDLARQLAQSQQSAAASSGPLVLALLCNVGHPNPTHASSCRSCGGPLSTQTTSVPRPALGRLVFSTGEVITLDRDVVVGRRPRAIAEPGRQEAQIVPVPSPKQEISRTHCQIRVDDWEVRVKDMGSNNGTYLTRPGEAALRLSDKTPMILQVGDRLDLGEGISIRMEA
ncbi:MAG: FHA domain-containing protein [Buchananella hordeovulneris]|nr:FHA domain-containing protein [Buchananella hordeovulneris]